MKVLLLHEMSGVHTELRNGLIKIGIDAKTATYGNLSRAYPSDIFIGREGHGVKDNLERLALQLKNIKLFNDFDVIQTISPNPFYRPISALIEKLILNNGKRYIYIAAGSDAIYRKHVRSLDYFPPHDWFERGNEYERCLRFVDNFSLVIPVCWEYKFCMERAGYKPLRVMPFPIDINKQLVRSPTKGKLRFFHPVNRDPSLPFDFKGTRLISSVFEKLGKKFSKYAEFFMKGGLSHNQYSTLTDDVDVIVDQVYSYSYGMSAAYGMAKGKVVLSGLEPITKDGEYYQDCPVINIRPSSADIEKVIETLIDDRFEVKKIAEASRVFAERHHSHIEVAKKFAALYSDNK